MVAPSCPCLCPYPGQVDVCGHPVSCWLVPVGAELRSMRPACARPWSSWTRHTEQSKAVLSCSWAHLASAVQYADELEDLLAGALMADFNMHTEDGSPRQVQLLLGVPAVWLLQLSSMQALPAMPGVEFSLAALRSWKRP